MGGQRTQTPAHTSGRSGLPLCAECLADSLRRLLSALHWASPCYPRWNRPGHYYSLPHSEAPQKQRTIEKGKYR